MRTTKQKLNSTNVTVKRLTKAQLEQELNELRAQVKAAPKKQNTDSVEYFEDGARAEVKEGSNGYYIAYYFTERTRKPFYISLSKLSSLEDNWNRLIELAESIE